MPAKKKLKVRLQLTRQLRKRLKTIRKAYGDFSGTPPATYAEIEDAARRAFEATRALDDALTALVIAERKGGQILPAAHNLVYDLSKLDIQ